MNRLLWILLLALALPLCAMAGDVLSVRDFGAKGDGVNIDSPAINAALRQAAESGGGTVKLDSGTYLAYSIHLQSGVALRLEKGAVIKAAPVTDIAGYDEAEPNESAYQDFGHSHWHNSLLWGENLRDVTIEGEGLIDGSGVLTRGGQKKSPAGQTTANKALAMRDCRNVIIRGLSFLNCGHFNFLTVSGSNASGPTSAPGCIRATRKTSASKTSRSSLLPLQTNNPGHPQGS